MKKDRFISASSPVDNKLLLVIGDFAWWTEHQTALEESIQHFHGRVRQQGMVLTFDQEQDRTMFLLKWT